MLKNTVLKYVTSELCCQTGICANICPVGAISIKYDKNGYLYPEINEKSCVKCGKCLKVCPVEKKELFEFLEAEKKTGINFDNAYGSYIGIYTGYSKNNEIRKNASSGGMLTHFLKYLLENKVVDAVITAKDKTASIYGPWAEISIITCPSELLQTQSSKYYPLSYENYLDFTKNYNRVAVVAIPCVIYGLKKLEKTAGLERNDIYLATVCSHNTSTKFATSLLMQQGFTDSDICHVNFRDKTNIPDHNEFNNKFSLYCGEKITKEIRVSRFKNNFTFLWRNYFFSKKACLFCPDFAGYMADAAFADAWNTPYTSDPGGNSLVIVRNGEINQILLSLNDKEEIMLREENIQTARKSQASQVNFKSVEYYKRVKLKENKFVPNIPIMLDYYFKILAIWFGNNFKVNNKISFLKVIFKLKNVLTKIIMLTMKFLRVGY